MTTNRPSSPNLEMPGDMPPVYTNLVRISHSPAELVFDFGCLLPGQPAAGLVARLLMSPIGAKLLYRALGDNLARYEAAFGEIPTPKDSSLADQLFRPTPPGKHPGEPEA